MKKTHPPEDEKRPIQHQNNNTFLHNPIARRSQKQNAGEYAERIEAIRSAFLEHLIEPANMDHLLSRLADTEGKQIRFSTASKPRKKNGSAIAFHDRGLPYVVLATDWATGAQMKWAAFDAGTLTPGKRESLKRRLTEAQKVREEELGRKWEARAAVAARLWHSCSPADPLHPYLQRKGIQPHRARQRGRELVLLLADFNGKAWSLQTITEAGEKHLMAGGRKAGNFITVDGPKYPARVLICEGYATGCTLAELDPAALVLAAVDCGNLQSVTTEARNRWPNVDLIVCGDDDRQTPGNPGATAARAAALAAGVRYALPEWPPAAPKHLSDYNDLHNWQRGRI